MDAFPRRMAQRFAGGNGAEGPPPPRPRPPGFAHVQRDSSAWSGTATSSRSQG